MNPPPGASPLRHARVTGADTLRVSGVFPGS
jgi:hypothetical protein